MTADYDQCPPIDHAANLTHLSRVSHWATGDRFASTSAFPRQAEDWCEPSCFQDSVLDAESAHAADTVPALRKLLMDVQRRQAEVVSQAAHELRTPLAAQRCIAETALLKGAEADQLEGAVVAMLEESRHMQHLIDSLLLVAQAEGGMLGTPRTAIDASRVAADAVRCIEPLAEVREHPISLRLQGPHFIVADPSLLRQALLNLIHNAITHTPAGTRIHVLVQGRNPGEVVISVVDDGPGMPRQEEGTKTPRFARRSEDRGAHVSLGLGLMIAKSLVRSQGGKTRIFSTPGRGTAIRLHFAASSAREEVASFANLKRRKGDR
jgi:two-component system OmpR family sensor kinase